MKKYLIINADDFGSSLEANDAIKRLLDKGVISSTTLMPTAKYYDETLEYARSNPKNIGLHLTLVDDELNYRTKSLSESSSFRDRLGYMLTDVNKFRSLLNYKEVKSEIKLQIKKLRNDEIDFTHIDMHRYSILPTQNFKAFIFLLYQCKKNKVAFRWSRNKAEKIGKTTTLTDSDNIAKFFGYVADCFKVPILDQCYKFSFRGMASYDEYKSEMLNIINHLPNGINEIHIHPCCFSERLKKEFPFWQERVWDFEIIQDKAIVECIKKNKIEMIKYSDIKFIDDRIQFTIKDFASILKKIIKEKKT